MAPRILRTRTTPALTAATRPVDDPRELMRTSLGGNTSGWQDEAWRMAGEVGELDFVADWIASAVSRCRLYAADIDTDTGEPVSSPTEDQAASQIVRDIGGSADGRRRMLYRLAYMLTIVGEAYLAMVTDDAGRQDWYVISRDELATRGTNTFITLPDGDRHTYDPERDMLARVWSQDPRKASQATSPVRSALPALREIVRSTRRIDNATRSRAVGNGLLFTPSEMSLPAPPSEDGTQQNMTAHDLQNMLVDVATRADDDPDSLVSFLPIVAQVPGEWVDKVRHITFDSEVTQTALDTRERAMKRLARSLRLSPERLLGIGESSSYWNAWSIDKTDVKVHIAPMLEIVCESLTRNILSPMIGDSQAVWFDTTPLTQDPDRKDEAREAFDRGALTAEAYLQYLGFDQDEDGYQLDSDAGWAQLARDKAAQDPTLIPLLAPLLGGTARQVTPVDTGPPLQAPNAPVDTSGAPAGAAAQAVTSLCVERCLELANKRLVTRQQRAKLSGTPMRRAHVGTPVDRKKALDAIQGWRAEIPDTALTTAGLNVRATLDTAEREALTALTTGSEPEATS